MFWFDCNWFCFFNFSVWLFVVSIQEYSWLFRIDWGFPDSSAGKESACNVGDLGPIPKLGRSPGEGKGYPLQYSGLENSMDSVVRGVAKSWTRLSDFHFHVCPVTLRYLGLPGGASGKGPACQCMRCERWGFDPWFGIHPWRRAVATHFSILAWRIPWTEEPGRLPSIGLHRVGHKGSNLARTHTILLNSLVSYWRFLEIP